MDVIESVLTQQYWIEMWIGNQLDAEELLPLFLDCVSQCLLCDLGVLTDHEKVIHM